MSSNTPFSFPFGMVPIANNPNSTGGPIVPTSRRWNMKSIFSDNAMVYYKPGSLAYGGVGTTRNTRAKSKKT